MWPCVSENGRSSFKNVRPAFGGRPTDPEAKFGFFCPEFEGKLVCPNFSFCPIWTFGIKLMSSFAGDFGKGNGQEISVLEGGNGQEMSGLG